MARALVIDDVPAFATLVRMVLESHGHTVTERYDSAEGIEIALRQPFDVVIVDMIMPGIDGIETVKRLRAGGSRAAVIAVSGGSHEFPASAALTLSQMHGADRLLFKPFANDELVATVDELLAVPRG